MAKRARRKAASRKRRRRVSGDPSLSPSVISGTRSRHKKHSRRRRKGHVGAVTGSDIGDLILGGIGGTLVGILVDKFVPLENAKIKDGIKLAGGAGVGYMGMKKKNMLVAGLGLGLLANGVTTGAHNFGIVAGLDEFMHGVGDGKDTMRIEMNGLPSDANIITGTNLDQPQIVSGDDVSGDEVSGEYMGSDDVSGTEQMGGDMPSVVQGYP